VKSVKTKLPVLIAGSNITVCLTVTDMVVQKLTSGFTLLRVIIVQIRNLKWFTLSEGVKREKVRKKLDLKLAYL